MLCLKQQNHTQLCSCNTGSHSPCKLNKCQIRKHIIISKKLHTWVLVKYCIHLFLWFLSFFKNLFIFFYRRDAFESSTEVSVSGGDSALKIRVPNEEYQVKLTPGVSLLEGSCQKSPEVNDDGLHIKLRLKVDEVFKRVLPLPNGNWNTLVDDWCCHPDPFANKKLHPKQEDCLLGDTYILLTVAVLTARAATDCCQCARDSFKPSTDISSLNHVLTPNILCISVSDVIKFYITEIVVKQKRSLASRLFELSSAQSIFRFSIQTPGGKSVIMLWLLNTDTLIASFSERVRSCDSLISASDHHLDEHQSCPAVCAVKVLYLPCTQAKAVNAWQKDITVHPLALPESTCEEILQLLTACTSTLPSSLRSMNSYQGIFLNLITFFHFKKK
uniref:E3 ubiquitin-protein ligase E3D n=1 Tax=Astyanax mexicanus TaxID=7994 RepID=A0A3B1J8C3_ASTMX